MLFFYEAANLHAAAAAVFVLLLLQFGCLLQAVTSAASVLQRARDLGTQLETRVCCVRL